MHRQVLGTVFVVAVGCFGPGLHVGRSIVLRYVLLGCAGVFWCEGLLGDLGETGSGTWFLCAVHILRRTASHSGAEVHRWLLEPLAPPPWTLHVFICFEKSDQKPRIPQTPGMARGGGCSAVCRSPTDSQRSPGAGNPRAWIIISTSIVFRIRFFFWLDGVSGTYGDRSFQVAPAVGPQIGWPRKRTRAMKSCRNFCTCHWLCVYSSRDCPGKNAAANVRHLRYQRLRLPGADWPRPVASCH